MNIILKVLNESTESLGHLDLDGISGRAYKFTWSKQHLGFTYLPANQEEIDDIFTTMAMPGFPWRFVPVLTEGTIATASGKPVAVRPAPYVPRKTYASYPLEDLVALCADCGFNPRNETDREGVLAQLDAYMLGRGAKEVEDKEPELSTPPAPPAEVAATTPPPAPVLTEPALAPE